ncbi:hypothetical protein ACFYXF_13725 [Streptomyces sp. NPDC002680]|uniref:hypothetical protein n=1 Tax=Streptomyces sp. NPDC002680 TaxID=3364659 RepID=UPI0036867114
MARPPHLRPEDRADFEGILHRALSATDIRTALRADSSVEVAMRLRAQALRDADEIVAAAGDEYRDYLAVRTAAGRGRESRPAGPGALLPALAVLTPPIAATSAAVLLLLGYALRLAAVRGTAAGSFIAAGWVLALVAATSALAALTALLRTAIRHRGGPAHGHGFRRTARNVDDARERWQRALLEHGMLPYLRQQLASTRPD